LRMDLHADNGFPTFFHLLNSKNADYDFKS